jgi:PadR family transcriptional regulator
MWKTLLLSDYGKRCRLNGTNYLSGDNKQLKIAHIHMDLQYHFQNSIVGTGPVMTTQTPEYRDLFPGALEMMILHSLRRKPMHGYALAKHIKQLSDELLQIEEGSLYPALQRMVKQGWLKSKLGISEKNRPIRVYALTKAGLKHLDKEVHSFEKMFAGIRRVLAAAQS